MAIKQDSITSPDTLTRREILKGAAVTAAAIGTGTLAGCADADLPDGTPVVRGPLATPNQGQRIAIVGGGAGGITAAHFLTGSYAVDLFEARDKLGGHCDSRTISYQGQEITVDLGAQFFHPATHPLYVTLLEEMGLYNPDQPATDQTLEAAGSLCLFPVAGGAPLFSSSNPLSTPFRAIDFAIYSQLARQAVLQNMSYEITVDQWINLLPVSSTFKNVLLRPWISALIGTTHANAMRASARSILQTFALAFPASITDGATTFNSKIGLGGNLQRVLERTPGVQVHLNAPAQALALESSGWFVQTPAGRQGPFVAVVLNAPPLVGRTLVRALPWAADIAGKLDVYEYFDSRILIHTDAAYVHRDRAQWAAYNGGIDGGECEGSVWLGAIHEKLPTGGTIDVFKSWAHHRRADPTNILLERRFKHPLISREAIRAARALRPMQGRNGLYMGGQYTTGMDLQESALYSAMKVAEALAPASPTLAALKTRLAARGRTGISYDL
jgi:predicted NAD/FAD-binding protein